MSGTAGSVALFGDTDKLSAALQIAERVYSLAQEQNDAALMIGAYNGLACTLFYLGDFEFATTIREAWRSDLAFGRRPVSCGRRPYASRRLSVLSDAIRVASRRDRHLPSEHGRSDLNSKGAK